MNALALLAILVALATQCGCAALGVAEETSVGSFTELSGAAPTVVTTSAPKATTATSGSKSKVVAVASGPKAATATAGPSMHFDSTKVLDAKVLSGISDVEHGKGEQKLSSSPSAVAAAAAVRATLILGKQVASKRKGESLHDKLTEQVGTFLIGLTKGKLIDEAAVETALPAGELRQPPNPFRVLTLDKLSQKSISDARTEKRQVISGLPRR